ncbi:hypothetical protein [Collimonas antrihumi]|uniref:hypothetical protein n=1 Tax=Collimonas antrihumi TaxID=1940615 RepID=UPI001B8B02BA|nr:hypothetical protein [Collimonas antrihumi]
MVQAKPIRFPVIKSRFVNFNLLASIFNWRSQTIHGGGFAQQSWPPLIFLPKFDNAKKQGDAIFDQPKLQRPPKNRMRRIIKILRAYHRVPVGFFVVPCF